MRKMEELYRPVDNGEAEGDEGVDGAGDEGVDNKLNYYSISNPRLLLRKSTT